MPMINTKIKIKLIINQSKGLDQFKFMIDGRIKVISTSKIKKIMAIKKNCNEKGTREEDFWSNPHSKEESFSRSNKDFFDKMLHAIIIILEIIVITISINIMFIINYLI